MNDESTKRAAEEYLAAKLAEEGQSYEDRLNNEAAVTLAPRVWKRAAETVIAKCTEWECGDERADLYLQGDCTWRSPDLVRWQIAAHDRTIRFQEAFDHDKKFSAA